MIVIPMAGLSQRFLDAGYTQPKYMLDLNGRSVFAHAVDSFRAYFTSEPFLFVARRTPGGQEFLEQELDELGVADAEIIWLDGPTAGQADTVRLGLAQAGVGTETSVTIFNIDTFRPGFRYPFREWFAASDGYLEVMFGSDPGFSYVSPLDGALAEERVRATAEKEVISEFASTGLYWFRRAGDFLEVCEAGRPVRGNAGPELYVAPLYNALIKRGCDIRFHRVPSGDVIFCGTPGQYEALRR